MVFVEAPLWVLHSTVTGPLSFDYTSIHHKEDRLEVSDDKAIDKVHDSSLIETQKTKVESIRTFFANKSNVGRNAIYTVDVCFTGNDTTSHSALTAGKRTTRFATGGGDGRVRVWSSNALFSSEKFGKSATNMHEMDIQHTVVNGNRSSSTGDQQSKTDHSIRFPYFNQQGEYESNSSSSISSSNDEKENTYIRNNETHAEVGVRLLCTLHSHEGSVLCTRWSHNGKYLASAGDDSQVLLYGQRSSASAALTGSTFGEPNSSPNVEHWARIRTCRGHGLDVVGLAWAPDDSHLASCSLDRDAPIIIWRVCEVLPGVGGYDVSKARRQGLVSGKNSIIPNQTAIGSSGTQGQILQPFRVLGQSVHRSAVKGVTWDPIGKYLCSSGDDPAICVWRAFGDWGLESRIDATSGIFPSGRRKHKNSGLPKVTTTINASVSQNTQCPLDGDTSMADENDNNEVDLVELANISLFRRISFAPDGSHVCATNATLKKKHIAAMISREGWAVSVGKVSSEDALNKVPVGAANLVGHTQPIVASRHCPVLLSYKKKSQSKKSKSSDESDELGKDSRDGIRDDEEPLFASLIALGDKRGFVTIWSTKISRPLFKMQVSDAGKSTITDMAWAFRYADRSVSAIEAHKAQGMILLVSMLDGHVAAISLSWAELGGEPLSDEETCRLFRLRYGVELRSDASSLMSGKTLVGSTGPKFIENAMQLRLEDDLASANQNDDIAYSILEREQPASGSAAKAVQKTLSAEETKIRQVETRKKGKKRIRPVLVSIVDDLAELGSEGTRSISKDKTMPSKTGAQQDPLISTLDIAERNAAAAEQISTKKRKKLAQDGVLVENDNVTGLASENLVLQNSMFPLENQITVSAQTRPGAHVPTSTSTVFTTNLSPPSVDFISDADGLSHESKTGAKLDLNAECSTSLSSPNGAWVSTLVINRNGKALWKDTLIGRCTALASSSRCITLGTNDGSLYMYGTSPTIGFECRFAFRSFPPIIFGSPIAIIEISETKGSDNEERMLVICSNGDFRLYNLASMCVLQQGSLVPALNHVRLASSDLNQAASLTRAQITDKGIVVFLSVQKSSVGGVQAFLYDNEMKAWLRIADSRFQVSDMYTNYAMARRMGVGHNLLGCENKLAHSSLHEIESFVSFGAQSPSSSANTLKNLTHDSSAKDVVTRAHCEDRMACSLALGSVSEFKHWLKLYARHLASSNDADYLRFLCDLILGKDTTIKETFTDPDCSFEKRNSVQLKQTHIMHSIKRNDAAWLDLGSRADILLGIKRRDLMQLVLTEMGRNRELQRLTCEVEMEVENLLKGET